jgi:hypothetical protein
MRHPLPASRSKRLSAWWRCIGCTGCLVRQHHNSFESGWKGLTMRLAGVAFEQPIECFRCNSSGAGRVASC